MRYARPCEKTLDFSKLEVERVPSSSSAHSPVSGIAAQYKIITRSLINLSQRLRTIQLRQIVTQTQSTDSTHYAQTQTNTVQRRVHEEPNNQTNRKHTQIANICSPDCTRTAKNNETQRRDRTDFPICTPREQRRAKPTAERVERHTIATERKSLTNG